MVTRLPCERIQLFEVYQKYACDVIGIQEVTPSWHSSALMTNMKAALDHIIGTAGDYKVLDYQIVTDQAALDATDHSPVFVDLEL